MSNDIIQSLYDRKSVRVYEDRPVEEDVKQAVLAAAIQAPTAGNMALYTIMNSCPTILCLVADVCFLEGSELPLFKRWLLLGQLPAKNIACIHIKIRQQPKRTNKSTLK